MQINYMGFHLNVPERSPITQNIKIYIKREMNIQPKTVNKLTVNGQKVQKLS